MPGPPVAVPRVVRGPNQQPAPLQIGVQPHFARVGLTPRPSAGSAHARPPSRPRWEIMRSSAGVFLSHFSSFFFFPHPILIIIQLPSPLLPFYLLFFFSLFPLYYPPLYPSSSLFFSSLIPSLFNISRRFLFLSPRSPPSSLDSPPSLVNSSRLSIDFLFVFSRFYLPVLSACGWTSPMFRIQYSL